MESQETTQLELPNPTQMPDWLLLQAEFIDGCGKQAVERGHTVVEASGDDGARILRCSTCNCEITIHPDGSIVHGTRTLFGRCETAFL